MGFRSTSGLTRKLTGARLPISPATLLRRSSSLSDSTLKHRMPLQALAHFIRSFFRHRKTPLSLHRASRQNARQLTPERCRNPAPRRAKKIQNGEAGVGLHRVADQMVALAKADSNSDKLPVNAAWEIDITRCGRILPQCGKAERIRRTVRNHGERSISWLLLLGGRLRCCRSLGGWR